MLSAICMPYLQVMWPRMEKILNPAKKSLQFSPESKLLAQLPMVMTLLSNLLKEPQKEGRLLWCPIMIWNCTTRTECVLIWWDIYGDKLPDNFSLSVSTTHLLCSMIIAFSMESSISFMIRFLSFFSWDCMPVTRVLEQKQIWIKGKSPLVEVTTFTITRAVIVRLYLV